ncbi:uncharacterized protein LOC114847085 [Betta splendens]|uniref:Uncharacterized protein LOC114847085 n=1 Tax=Betta splendens TaxID=158456 RepID=A0A6P7LDM1_BETSP|nr:uncharacterized protein LOC114847085 [Betta splendens]
MAASRIVFYLTSLFVCKMAQMTDLKSSSSFQQWSSFVSVKVGDKVSLFCFYEAGFSLRLYWFKQPMGHKPQFMATFNQYDDVNHAFYDEFRNNPRYLLKSDSGKNHLTITDVDISDSATYYCLSTYSYRAKIVNVTTVSVKGSDSNLTALVHQSASGSIQPGGSVTLNCIIQTGTCDGQHSVYWFKNSGEALPGLIYSHGDRNDQCERKPDIRTHTCVYNLPLQSLNASDAGTYYCAIALCGHIVFGNGTELDLKYQDSHLVNVLRSALIFTSLLSVLLAFLVCKVMNNHLWGNKH